MDKNGPEVLDDVDRLRALLVRSDKRRGRGREAVLTLWLRVNRQRFAEMLAEEGATWPELAAALSRLGIKDGDGKPPSGDRLRKAWAAQSHSNATGAGTRQHLSHPAATSPGGHAADASGDSARGKGIREEGRSSIGLDGGDCTPRSAGLREQHESPDEGAGEAVAPADPVMADPDAMALIHATIFGMDSAPPPKSIGPVKRNKT